MHYGDEHCIVLDADSDPDQIPSASLQRLFRHAERLTRFADTPDNSFIHDRAAVGYEGLRCYKIDAARMIEINDVVLEHPLMIRNQVADLISFQFVSSVKRSEFLGKRKHVHDLGPALIVTAIPRRETTSRMPKPQVQIRHVVVHTTLSRLLENMQEPIAAYPAWLVGVLEGNDRKPQQRVFFLEDIHREPIWSCFHLPVSGSLLGAWMTAKFNELLCIGLQILKNSHSYNEVRTLDLDLPYAEKIRRARNLLSSEYAHPPSLPGLAQTLGISETQLKSGFKAMNGITVMQYCITKRVEAAKLLLKDNRHSISEIGDIVGYEDHSAFSRAFRRLTGCTPLEWRKTWNH
jgi:AraC-like DNA-binding protein